STEQMQPEIQPESQRTQLPETQPAVQIEHTTDVTLEGQRQVQTSTEHLVQAPKPTNTQSEVQPAPEPVANVSTQSATEQPQALPSSGQPPSTTTIPGLDAFPGLDLEGLVLDDETMAMLETAMSDETMLAELVEMLKSNDAPADATVQHQGVSAETSSQAPSQAPSQERSQAPSQEPSQAPSQSSSRA